MYNRNQSQRQNPQNIPVFVDYSSTPAGMPQVNSNNPFILRPIANNQQMQAPARLAHPTTMPFPVEYWRANTTLPTDPTSPTVLYADPQAYIRAHTTKYPPQGQPVTTQVLPFGYQLNGMWHVGFLDDVIAVGQQRSNPDVLPMWNYSQLQNIDNEYRNMNVTIPGTNWPTAAVGMTTNLPVLRAAERSGMHICNVDRNGYVEWIWQGTQ